MVVIITQHKVRVSLDGSEAGHRDLKPPNVMLYRSNNPATGKCSRAESEHVIEAEIAKLEERLVQLRMALDSMKAGYKH